jgi:hypothetical protein
MRQRKTRLDTKEEVSECGAGERGLHREVFAAWGAVLEVNVMAGVAATNGWELTAAAHAIIKSKYKKVNTMICKK